MDEPYKQLDLFAIHYEKPALPKKVRLIELFAGIGAQRKALKALGVEFESHRVCEWSVQSIIAYNAIHVGDFSDKSGGMSYEEVLKAIEGVSNDYMNPMTPEQIRGRGEPWARKIYSSIVTIRDLKPDVSTLRGEDLGIVDKDEWLYCLTYSFPCQDLSLAGLGKGMEKGSGTRSGLLWEVGRILEELHENRSLPQVLLMENVPEVCSSKNKKPWAEWQLFLSGLGYTNYVEIINAKDYDIPQNRRRCFMLSLLGKQSYDMPVPTVGLRPLKDFLDDDVPEEYYLPDELVDGFVPTAKEDP